MAFNRATGKINLSRKQRNRMGAAGAVALVAAITGPLAAPATAALTATAEHQTGLTQTKAVGPLAEDSEDSGDQDDVEAGEKVSGGSEKSDKSEKVEKAEKDAAERGGEKRSDRSSRAKLNGFLSPIKGGDVTTQYNSGGARWSSGTHSGIDFAAAEGTPVKTAGPGTVVEAGWGGSYGNNIVVQHNDGRFTQYGHLSKMDVNIGEKVTSGESIGRVGSTGNSTGPHLHFEARTTPAYGSDVNPINYLRDKGVGLG
ncbi:M23 family metallopeptidase [Streptomyces sp. XM4193]|uniref:M23 family metallopeptidase n=1 Tax=Streptomyces sp. XM4193 TaxID=2929782 RepID=UPI001FF8FD87|nr:M23 family metallopeptidase [Streptomyces sp. XM4193]MCK1798705.1 M23 family metallopeptidase [Streptomyces sp. XM4193]